VPNSAGSSHRHSHSARSHSAHSHRVHSRLLPADLGRLVTLECQSRQLAFDLEAATQELAQRNAKIAELTREITSLQGRFDEERKVLHNEILELRGNVRVYARVRPLSGSEAALGDCSPIVAQVENQAIALIPPDNPQVVLVSVCYVAVNRPLQSGCDASQRRNVVAGCAPRRAGTRPPSWLALGAAPCGDVRVSDVPLNSRV
jgi:hypothetical protein